MIVKAVNKGEQREEKNLRARADSGTDFFLMIE